MGQWFSKFFIDQGCTVNAYGRNGEKMKRIARRLGITAARSISDSVEGADIIVISVTPESFEKVVRQVAPHLRRGQYVIDITSVKSGPVKAMHRHIKGALVLGTHPMFGPKRSAKGQNFILTPSNPRERKFASELASYLHQRGFNPIIMSPKEHDRMISVVISLTHFIGFVTADTWRMLHAQKFMREGSTSFRFLESFVDTIVDSNPELYSYLQTGVPNAYRAELIFARKSKEWSDLTRKKDNTELQKRMAELKKYFSRLK